MKRRRCFFSSAKRRDKTLRWHFLPQGIVRTRDSVCIRRCYGGQPAWLFFAPTFFVSSFFGVLGHGSSLLSSTTDSLSPQQKTLPLVLPLLLVVFRETRTFEVGHVTFGVRLGS